MKLPEAPLGGVLVPLRPRLAGFPFHSNKLRGITATLGVRLELPGHSLFLDHAVGAKCG